MKNYNLCIIKPNKSAVSETFIQEHIDRLKGNKKVLYGGDFPLYDDEDKFLIRSKLGIMSYLIQKRIFGKKDIKVRTNALSAYLRRNKIDVVFAEYGMVGAMVTAACKLADVPLVINFHGADVHNRNTVKEYNDFYKKAFNYASEIVGVSLDMINELEKLGADRAKLHFVSCGVDPDRFSMIPVHTTEKRFLAVGRFVEKKSPLSVIKAFNKVLSKIPAAELWMIGGGPLFKQAEQLVQELDIAKSVHLMGVQNQSVIRELMSSMCCFVQHSVTAENGDMEGTPVTILEAGAVGLPIVSTKHAGIKQAVLDGESGFLVDEYDIDGMASRMIEVAELSPEALKAMGMAGRAHILSNYSISGQIDKLDAIISMSIRRL